MQLNYRIKVISVATFVRSYYPLYHYLGIFLKKKNLYSPEDNETYVNTDPQIRSYFFA